MTKSNAIASGTQTSDQEIILKTHPFRKPSLYLLCTVVKCVFETNFLEVPGKMRHWYTQPQMYFVKSYN